MPTPLTPRQATLMMVTLASFGPFSIDAYLPAFHAIEREFNVSTFSVQQTITAYMLPFCLFMLLHGVLADCFGRKRVLITGLVVYTMGTTLCFWSDQIHWFYLGRILQGASIGVGMVVGRAIIRDLFDSITAQRIAAQVMMMFALAPSIAPIIGGQIHVLIGWRYLFVLLFVVALLCVAWIVLRLPETLNFADRATWSFRALITDYVRIISSRAFLRYVMTFGFLFAGVFLYVVLSPEIILRHFALDETQFYWLFTPLTAGLLLGALTASKLSARQANRQLYWGVSIALLGAVLNVASNIWLPMSPWFRMWPLFFINFGLGLATPRLSIAAIDLFPKRRGMASSMMSALQMGSGVLSSLLLAPLLKDSLIAIAWAMLVLACIAFGLILDGVDRHGSAIERHPR